MPKGKRGTARVRVIRLGRPLRMLLVTAAVCTALLWGRDIAGLFYKLSDYLAADPALVRAALSMELSEKPAGAAENPPAAAEPDSPAASVDAAGSAADPDSSAASVPEGGSPDDAYETGLIAEDLLTYAAESPDPETEDALPVAGITIPSGTDPISLRNETSYKIDIDGLLSRKNAFKLSGDGPHILIIHTHTSEAYTPDGQNSYTPDDTDRTLDPEYNVVRVGNELTKLLTDAGFSVLHNTEIHDYPSYNGSYNRTLDDLTEIMKEHPSIKVVIDLHRDALTSASGVKYKPVAQIDGRQAAQVMLVVGTAEGGLPHPNWKDNLSFALKIQKTAQSMFENLMRPVNIRKERFNEHVTTGSLLIEVGSSGNTLDEALYGIDLFSDALIQVLNTYKAD